MAPPTSFVGLPKRATAVKKDLDAIHRDEIINNSFNNFE